MKGDKGWFSCPETVDAGILTFGAQSSAVPWSGLTTTSVSFSPAGAFGKNGTLTTSLKTWSWKM